MDERRRGRRPPRSSSVERDVRSRHEVPHKDWATAKQLGRPPCAECGEYERLHHRRLCLQCRREQMRKYIARRRESPEHRVRERLKRYGIEDGDTSKFAAPSAACDICGVPNKFLTRRAQEDRSPWMGSPQFWTRLSIDHINPADRSSEENLRPLCYHCNTVRQDGRRSDEEVRRKAFRFWRLQYHDRFLRWLKEPK